MKIIVIIISLIIAPNINSDYKKPGKKIVELGNYESININGPFRVQLYSGKEGEIELTGNNTTTELIEIFIYNDELIIRPIKMNWSFKSWFGRINKYKDLRKIKINIPVEDINKISLNGSGNITSKDILENKAFAIKINGSGNIEVNLNSDEIIAKINGSGNIILRGKSKESEFKINGSGSIQAIDLLSRRVDAKISGSGNIELFSINNPSTKINGSGNIHSYGPNKFNHKIFDID